MIARWKTMLAATLQDLPWSGGRTRSLLVVLLPLMGLLGGTVQGLLLHDVFREDYPGDVFAWNLIEFSAWQGAALGLAAGAALATTRHVAGRLVLGTMFGFMTMSAVFTLHYDSP